MRTALHPHRCLPGNHPAPVFQQVESTGLIQRQMDLFSVPVPSRVGESKRVLSAGFLRLRSVRNSCAQSAGCIPCGTLYTGMVTTLKQRRKVTRSRIQYTPRFWLCQNQIRQSGQSRCRKQPWVCRSPRSSGRHGLPGCAIGSGQLCRPVHEQAHKSATNFAPHIAELERQGKRAATRQHYLDDF